MNETVTSWTIKTPRNLKLSAVLENDATLVLRTNPNRRKWESIARQIAEYRKLPKNWDGEGTTSPSFKLIESTLYLIDRLQKADSPAPSRTAPGISGSILLEWQNDGSYLLIEVIRPYVAEAYFAPKGKPSTLEELEFGTPIVAAENASNESSLLGWSNWDVVGEKFKSTTVEGSYIWRGKIKNDCFITTKQREMCS